MPRVQSTGPSMKQETLYWAVLRGLMLVVASCVSITVFHKISDLQAFSLNGVCVNLNSHKFSSCEISGKYVQLDCL